MGLVNKRNCKVCGTKPAFEDGDFCSWVCQQVYVWHKIRIEPMGKYDVDYELYIAWQKEKQPVIEAMMTEEEIETRIIEIINIKFYAEREWQMLHMRLDKLTNRKGIPKWIREGRDALITDPHIKVNYEGEPRKKEPKEKKPKSNLLKELLGIDMAELTKDFKKSKEAGNGTPSKPIETKVTMDDFMDQMLNPKPKPVVPVISDEEKAAKVNAMKEKMRLAKEAKEGKKE